MLEAKTVLEAVVEHGKLTHDGVARAVAPRGALTMGTLIDHYIEKELPKLSELTIRYYKPYLLKMKIALGDLEPKDLRPKDLYAFIDGITDKVSVQNILITLFRNLFRIAIRKGACDTNPARDMERESWGTRERVPNLIELRTFIEKGGPWWKCYVFFKLMTGLRQRDILALPPIPVEATHFTLEISKSRRWRKDRGCRVGRQVTYEVTEELRHVLREIYSLKRPRRAERLFCAPRGGAYVAQRFNKAFLKILRACEGVQPFHEHDIRATAALLDPSSAKKRLGHKHQTTTDIYLRAFEGETITPLSLAKAQENPEIAKIAGIIHHASGEEAQ